MNKRRRKKVKTHGWRKKFGFKLTRRYFIRQFRKIYGIQNLPEKSPDMQMINVMAEASVMRAEIYRRCMR